MILDDDKECADAVDANCYDAATAADEPLRV